MRCMPAVALAALPATACAFKQASCKRPFHRRLTGSVPPLLAHDALLRLWNLTVRIELMVIGVGVCVGGRVHDSLLLQAVHAGRAVWRVTGYAVSVVVVRLGVHAIVVPPSTPSLPRRASS